MNRLGLNSRKLIAWYHTPMNTIEIDTGCIRYAPAAKQFLIRHAHGFSIFLNTCKAYIHTKMEGFQ
jgi:hypothetical protein